VQHLNLGTSPILQTMKLLQSLHNKAQIIRKAHKTVHTNHRKTGFQKSRKYSISIRTHSTLALKDLQGISISFSWFGYRLIEAGRISIVFVFTIMIVLTKATTETPDAN